MAFGFVNPRHQKVKARINQTSGYPVCVVLDCGRTTTARGGTGLNKNYCRVHVEHYRRHGSYSKASYNAPELRPHLAKASAWLAAHGAAMDVQEALDKTRALLWRGIPEEAFRLNGMSPQDRAGVIWARLRKHQIDPARVLAIWLSIELCHAADMQPESKRYFRHVQAGKALHRLSGGSHKKWIRELQDGAVEVTVLHKYPTSRGRVLVHLGEALAKAAQPLQARLVEISNPIAQP